MKAFVAAALIAGVAVSLPPTVSAASQDDQFLAALARAGIPAHDGIPSVIEYGHAVCQALDGGMAPGEVVDRLANYAYGLDPSNDLGRYQRSFVRFIQVAVSVYCPGTSGGISWDARRRVMLASYTVPAEVSEAPVAPPPVPVPDAKLLTPPVTAPGPATKKPPAVGPQTGVGGGRNGSGADGGNRSGPAPAVPSPDPGPGHIVLLP